MEQIEILRGSVPSFMDGSGDGYGDGSGSGYGYGSGSGYGYGYGDGYGPGYGSGAGDGYGDGPYWLQTIKYFAAKWSDAQQARMKELEKAGAKICFWRSKPDGTPANGGYLAPVKVGDIQRVQGPLKMCSARALHGTLIPPKWPGKRVWIVALIGEIQGDDEKYGALEREILGEAL